MCVFIITADSVCGVIVCMYVCTLLFHVGAYINEGIYGVYVCMHISCDLYVYISDEN